MPDDRLADKIRPRETYPHRGGIYYLRDTPGARLWIRLLRDPRVPDLGDRQVVVLTGQRNRALDDLGMCQPERHRGREYYSIFLDDPHPKELASAEDDLRRFLRGTFSRSFFRQCRDAWLIQIYLHELGHARYCTSHSWRGPSDRHEEAAERYAWHQLEKLYPRDVLLGALSLFWMLGSEDG